MSLDIYELLLFIALISMKKYCILSARNINSLSNLLVSYETNQTLDSIRHMGVDNKTTSARN